MTYLKWWKGRTYNQEYSTQQHSPTDLMEKSKDFQKAKVKRIQHHQTSFKTNAKVTFLDKKSKTRKRPTENKPKTINTDSNQFSSVQSLSRVRLFVTPWIAVHQASLSITNSRSSLRLTSIELVMPCSNLIFCCPLLFLPSIPPSIRVFSNESTLCMRWPKYWSFSFSIIPSKEIPGLISFRMDWLDLLAV